MKKPFKLTAKQKARNRRWSNPNPSRGTKSVNKALWNTSGAFEPGTLFMNADGTKHKKGPEPGTIYFEKGDGDALKMWLFHTSGDKIRLGTILNWDPDSRKPLLVVFTEGMGDQNNFDYRKVSYVLDRAGSNAENWAEQVADLTATAPDPDFMHTQVGFWMTFNNGLPKGKVYEYGKWQHAEHQK